MGAALIHAGVMQHVCESIFDTDNVMRGCVSDNHMGFSFVSISK